MFKVEPTGPFCSQQTSLFQLPQWFPGSPPPTCDRRSPWPDFSWSRWLAPSLTVISTVACWWIGWHSQHTSCLLFVVLFLQWILCGCCFCQSFICELCVCVTFGFNDSGVRSVFGDLHGLILHSFHWGYSMLQVSSMTFSICRSFMCVSVYLQ